MIQTEGETSRCKKAIAAIAAGVLAASTLAPAIALADGDSETGSEENAATVGTQTGTGKTELTVQLASTGEHGGTDDPTNPDDDGDGLGDNIAFTVPSKINFVVKPNGELVAPDAANTYLENHSSFNIHASSLQATAETGWNVANYDDIVAGTIAFDGASSTSNNVGIAITPNSKADGKIDISNYLTKSALPGSEGWNMSSGVDGDAVITDRVQMSTVGQVNGVTYDLSKATKFAELEWYVTPGVNK